MKLKEYLEKKHILSKEVEDNFSRLRYKCLSCMRPKKICFCNQLKSFTTFFEFRILMHPMEAKKESIGTGRLTNHLLKNCKIIIDESFDKNVSVQNILKDNNYYPMVLYPGNDSINLSKTNLKREPFKIKKPLLFIIDGTWPCAKSMMKKSTTLQNLPRISFDASVRSRFIIKHQPASYCLSTIESVYEVLSLLEFQKIEKTGDSKEQLLFALNKLVQFQINCANDPKKNNYLRKKNPFKQPEERIQNKKWDK